MKSDNNKSRSITLVLVVLIIIIAITFLFYKNQHKYVVPPVTNGVSSSGTSTLSTSDISLGSLDTLQNQYRQQLGLSTFTSGNLILSASLISGADAICKDMVQNNYFSYTAPSGQTLNNKLLQITSNAASSVNVSIIEGYDSASAVFSALIKNSGDLNNITNPNFTDDGLAVCKSENYLSNGSALIVVLTYATAS